MINQEESKAVLVLEDGTLFYGRSSAEYRIACGEIVFNTAMTGYQEICTDPSYANQIVLFTTSHIGNVGVNEEDTESSQVWVKAVIAREISQSTSHWKGKKSFVMFLNEHKIPWIEGIDTRKLIRHIRNKGTKNACIMVGEIKTDFAIELAKKHVPTKALRAAFAPRKYLVQNGEWPELGFSNVLTDDAPKIFVYDFGVKLMILKALARLGCKVEVVPYTTLADEVLSRNPDGIILSNGPGDPASIGDRIVELQKLISSKVPVFGICLGCQLIAIAAGGSTKRMKFGHHGANHPVYDIKKKKVYITSQNHNFVIDENTLPFEFEMTHVSLLDGSLQGIRSKKGEVMGFQGHPEGSPGPQDIGVLFEEFLTIIHKKKSQRCL